jgi:hypothetical protein
MIRVLLATGQPRLNAELAAAPDLEIVADAYYAEAATTAVSELRPEVLVMSETLPGARLVDLASVAAANGVRVVRVGGELDCDAVASGGAPSVTLAPDAGSAVILGAIRSLPERHGAQAIGLRDSLVTDLHVFLGCLPRLGVSTAALVCGLAARAQGGRPLVVDANFAHPCLPEMLGRGSPEVGWTTASTSAHLCAAVLEAHGIRCLPMGRADLDSPDQSALETAIGRLGWVIQAERDQADATIVIDLGSPSPLHRGRLSAWLPWLGAVGASAELVVAQDPQALLGAARILRAAGAAGVHMRAWCANFDEHISTIDELSMALGQACTVLPWDRRAVVLRALAGKPPDLRLALAARV